MQPRAPAQRKQLDALRNHVLADLAGREVARGQDLVRDEMHLAEVGRWRGDVFAGAVLDVWRGG